METGRKLDDRKQEYHRARRKQDFFSFSSLNFSLLSYLVQGVAITFVAHRNPKPLGAVTARAHLTIGRDG